MICIDFCFKKSIQFNDLRIKILIFVNVFQNMVIKEMFKYSFLWCVFVSTTGIVFIKCMINL